MLWCRSVRLLPRTLVQPGKLLPGDARLTLARGKSAEKSQNQREKSSLCPSKGTAGKHSDGLALVSGGPCPIPQTVCPRHL